MDHVVAAWRAHGTDWFLISATVLNQGLMYYDKTWHLASRHIICNGRCSPLSRGCRQHGREIGRPRLRQAVVGVNAWLVLAFTMNPLHNLIPQQLHLQVWPASPLITSRRGWEKSAREYRAAAAPGREQLTPRGRRMFGLITESMHVCMFQRRS